MKKNNVEVKGIVISYRNINQENYISLTYMARTKNTLAPADVVKNWFRTRTAIEYMGLWEKFYNPNVNMVEIDHFINESGKNAFTLSPTQWIKEINAIGVITKAGKYDGGTFAHQDIAFKFASWLSTEFEFYLIKEFQRLKIQENKELEWNAKRELAKINYRIHTDAIKENIVPTLTDKQLKFVYANEADLLNVALFGKTASEWRSENTDLKGNIRDYATIEQLLVVANMESYNAILIEQKLSQSERLLQLNNMAKSQLRVLQNQNNTKLLENNKP